ncbi:MAG: alanine/ornithine racemase family PLP-dependent enzyme [Marmoricola sp.]
MNAPRVEIDLGKVEHNTRTLVDRLGPRGIRVTGITKAALGFPGVGAAMLRGGAVGLGDSRLQNLSRLADLDGSAARTLIRSPMLSQASQVVRAANVSLNTERAVLEALDDAATRFHQVHDVVLMVELGDLREGIPAAELLAASGAVLDRPSLRLFGIGTNLACQNGVVPDAANMGELTRLALTVEHAHGVTLEIVSGGNSANLDWALSTDDVGRIDELRLGEAILLGTEPLHRTAVPGLHTDAFQLVAEVIEVRDKPARPWGSRAQTAFGELPERTGNGTLRQAILALGRQDVAPEGLYAADGITVLGMSSDHLVLDIGDHALAVGDELRFALGYGALVRAMTSPFVAKVEHAPRPAELIVRDDRSDAPRS